MLISQNIRNSLFPMLHCLFEWGFYQGRIWGGAAVYLTTPMESYGLEGAKFIDVTCACSVHMYQCIN
jgi:hypothetical protein